MVRMVAIPVEDFLHLNRQPEDLITLFRNPIEFLSGDLYAIHCPESFIVNVELGMRMLCFEQNPGSIKELLVKLRMGNRHESVRPSSHVFSVQRSNAKFCDDVVNIGARGNDAGAGGQLRDDAGDRSVLGRRWKGYDRLTPLGRRGTTDKIHLTSETAVNRAADRIAAYLAADVD